MAKTGTKKARRSSNAQPKNAAGQARKRNVCFVIMPFGGWLDDYYETIYRPAIHSAGLEAHRADDLYRPSTIVNDIWSYTKRAKVLLADLTGKNPNVFYELGLAHAIAKPAILVSESIDDIPFDLRALRVIVYEKNDPMWGENLKEKVTIAIGEVLKAPQEAVLPGFLHVRKSEGAGPITRHEKELIELKQDMELLRREMRRNGPPRRIREIEPREAREQIRRMISRGYPTHLIIERLEPLGPPRDWIMDEIKDQRNRTKHLAAEMRQPAKAAAEPAAGSAHAATTADSTPKD